MFGLLESDLVEIKKIISSYPEICEAVIFGSRAKGSYKVGSDVDIAIKGNSLESVTLDLSTHLNQETLLPYFFDIVDYDSITNQALKEHIDRVGQSIYRT